MQILSSFFHVFFLMNPRINWIFYYFPPPFLPYISSVMQILPPFISLLPFSNHFINLIRFLLFSFPSFFLSILPTITCSLLFPSLSPWLSSSPAYHQVNEDFLSLLPPVHIWNPLICLILILRLLPAPSSLIPRSPAAHHQDNAGSWRGPISRIAMTTTVHQTVLHILPPPRLPPSCPLASSILRVIVVFRCSSGDEVTPGWLPTNGHTPDYYARPRANLAEVSCRGSPGWGITQVRTMSTRVW